LGPPVPGSEYASALVVGNDDLALVIEEVANDSTLVDDETIDVLFDDSTLT
jgi:hypothetical protein